ncbi:MAG: Hsp20/alpha crystallin family protein [Desulfomonilia bacterium]|nr:Hsp20/alpha crystallin family protein [Desulfomonilia bacterium]
MKYMTPWKWGRKDIAESSEYEGHPVDMFRREMDRLFDDFFKGFGLRTFGEERDVYGKFSPQINMTEDEKFIQVTAELPGMDEKDIEVNLTKDSITIKGEKKEETEQKDKGVYYLERSFGSFMRAIPLPQEVDGNKAEASFKKGVLKISLPKLAREKQTQKKITIKSE